MKTFYKLACHKNIINKLLQKSQHDFYFMYAQLFCNLLDKVINQFNKLRAQTTPRILESY